MSFAAIDLSKLPSPDIVETIDFEDIVSAIIADLTNRDATLAPVLAEESEPIVKLLEACAYREVNIRARVNAAARGVMLAFATGTTLDNIVANLGVTREDGETDDALRARAALAPEGWSVAGPEGAYIFWAKSASAAVADVKVTSPTPGAVRVAVLSTDADGVADAELLGLVTAAITNDDVRPLTDNVTVVSASMVTFAVEATLYVASGLDTAVVQAAATAAVTAYAASRQMLGKGIARMGVGAALMAPGVDNLVLASPAADIEASPEVAPLLTAVNLTMIVGSDGV